MADRYEFFVSKRRVDSKSWNKNAFRGKAASMANRSPSVQVDLMKPTVPMGSG